MSSRPSGPFLAPPRPVTSLRSRVQRPEADERLDALLPDPVRRASSLFWTPVEVAERAAALFAEHGARNILDVGSGVGKLCVAAAAARPDLWFTGIEHRPHLVETAQALARSLQLTNVTFRVAEVTGASWSGFDGLYFFNPFGENLFGDEEDLLDRTVELGAERFFSEVARAESRLAACPVGVVVITYHGFGGCIPGSFQLAHAERSGTNWLRVWVKRVEGTGGTSAWRELYDGGVRPARNLAVLRP